MNLSSFYRSSLSNGKVHISIGQELEISRAYLEILQIRYFHKFDFTITCPEALKTTAASNCCFSRFWKTVFTMGSRDLTGTEFFILRRKMLGIVSGLRFRQRTWIFKRRLRKIWQQDADHFGIKSIQQRILLYYGRVMDYLWKVPNRRLHHRDHNLPKRTYV